jgi:hypothetical protein
MATKFTVKPIILPSKFPASCLAKLRWPEELVPSCFITLKPTLGVFVARIKGPS